MSDKRYTIEQLRAAWAAGKYSNGQMSKPQQGKRLEDLRKPKSSERRKYVEEKLNQLKPGAMLNEQIYEWQAGVIDYWLTQTDLPILLDAFPALRDVFMALIGLHENPEYNYLMAMEKSGELIAPYVGWTAADERVRTSQHFDLVREAIRDILPPDKSALISMGLIENPYSAQNIRSIQTSLLGKRNED